MMMKLKNNKLKKKRKMKVILMKKLIKTKNNFLQNLKKDINVNKIKMILKNTITLILFKVNHLTLHKIKKVFKVSSNQYKIV